MASTSRLMARYRDLDAEADAMIGAGPAGPGIRPVGSEPVPTEIHRQTLDLLDELFAMVTPANGGPMGPMLRTLHTMRGRLLKDFASVPADRLAAFLHDLGAKMMAVGAPQLPPAPPPEPIGDDGPAMMPPGHHGELDG